MIERFLLINFNMGRMRKRFNERARQSSSGTINQDEKEKVIVDIDVQNEKYDSNNPLVICGKKKEKKKTSEKEKPERKPLSRKQKKKLEKILVRKKKKLNRAELLEKLSRVQLKPQESDLFTSTSSMQTHGLKRLIQENTVSTENKETKISNIKGSKRKDNLPPSKKVKLDPNIVSCEISSSESDESSDEDEGSMNVSSTENAGTDSSKTVSDDEKGEIRKDVEGNSKEEAKNEDVTVLEKAKTESSSKETVPVSHEPAVFVPVNRLPEVQTAREALPIFCEEQSIMEAIKENSVVVIHGETGSGKTTQVPQFLYEGGYTRNDKVIGITEPRRIAAMTMAARVGQEMNLTEIVAYHVRYENNVTDKTQIKFMTDGVLLKEIRHDFYLTKYSVIIIDEAHERSVFSDVLIGLLSRIVPLREKKGNPLKLIVMSATIRVQDFTENPRLFKEPPFLIKLESRQYKVQVHFNIQTPDDYVEAAYRKVCNIHNQLPSGAILVFLTGEKEVIRLCKMLRNTFPFKDKDNPTPESLNEKDEPTPSVAQKREKKKKKESDDQEDQMMKMESAFCSLPSVNLDDYAVEPLDTENLEHEMSDEEDSSADSLQITEKPNTAMPLYTLPLYSILPFSEQEKVFQPPPEGTRLCVVSTNVAETSITIPGLKYVVDSGKVKTKVYDGSAGGISHFSVVWTSKASANQRAGRAGRTEGGHCYRLYSSSVFQHEFLDFTPPEIQRIPVDDVLLQMKALGIDRVVNFPFPSPPDSDALKSAERRLVLLGALQDLKKSGRLKEIKKWEFSAKVTPLGKAMSRFPLSPRFAKMLILSYKHSVVPYIIAVISAMTVPQVFHHSTSSEDSNPEETTVKKINIGTGKSLQLGDAMVLLKAVAMYEESKNKLKFCMKFSVRHKAMIEIHKMCLQLVREMNKAFQDLSLPMELNLSPPNEDQLEKLRKILCTGFTDHVARLLPEEEMKLNKELKNAYKCLDFENPVFIHPSSVLFSELPRYVIYQEIVKTTKYYMKGVVEIDPEWLPAFAPSLCTFSEPLKEPAPSYDPERDRISCSMNVTFGQWQWELPCVTMEMPKSDLKYSYFAFFLLDGQVFKFFQKYKTRLLSSPNTLLKDWAKNHTKIVHILNALHIKEVDSKEALEKIWETDPKYLLREYWEWLPSSLHMEIELQWPPKA